MSDSDPAFPRKRTKQELMCLMQAMAGSSQSNGGINMPSGIEDEMLPGLTKRELFAALMTAALISGTRGEVNWTEKQFAIGGINIADALLAELERGVPPPKEK